MTVPLPIHIVYCSWNPFKKEEWENVRASHTLEADTAPKLSELFSIEFRKASTSEPLLCDLEDMVRHKALSAYRSVRVPCIVEHAGLILEGHEAESFPGGLTQPMWDALGAEAFLACALPLSKRVIARAVVGYCDGLTTKTFVGDTRGKFSDRPKGNREFYWDTVFCPDGGGGKTYSEIVGDDRSGLPEKMKLSQSVKALKAFMVHRLKSEPVLFPGV